MRKSNLLLMLGLSAIALVWAASMPVKAQVGSEVSANITLVKAFPFNIIFISMARRAVADYSLDNLAFPIDLKEVEHQGYSPYLLGSPEHLSYDVRDGIAWITSNGNPVYDGLDRLSPMPMSARIPDRSRPYILKEGSTAKQNGSQIVWVNEVSKVWQYPGAQWVDAGASESEFAEALRYWRIQSHLAFAAVQFEKIHGRMPESLNELEKFVGLERNPPAWRNVSLVSIPAEVELASGNLYVGPVAGNRFMISMNAGVEVITNEFEWTGTRWKLLTPIEY